MRYIILPVVFVLACSSQASIASTRFLDEFDGTEIDPVIWNTDIATAGQRWCSIAQATSGDWLDVAVEPCGWEGPTQGEPITQEPPYGNITFGDGQASFSAGPIYAFPYIWAGPPSRPSPFPSTGDFILEAGMKFDFITGSGDGLLATFWENTDPEGNNPPAPFGQSVIRIWGDNGELHADLLGIKYSLPETLAPHDYRLEYVDGSYSLFVDGKVTAGPTTSTLRPNVVWLGNPSFNWGPWTWTDFKIDYVRVDAVPPSGNASFSDREELDVLDIDFGAVPLNAVVASVPFSVTNLAESDAMPLSLDSVLITGDSHILATDAHSVSQLSPAETVEFIASMNTTTVGDFASTSVFNFSDTEGNQQPLTLNVFGKVLARLQAGDVNQDYSFDQLDLVEVFLANKYLTGEPATWGEGDWDGAPGGAPGSPPLGDGVFDQKDIVAALAAGYYLNGPYAAIMKGGGIGDGQTSIIYNADTGELAVDAPAGTELTSINIDSSASIFTGNRMNDNCSRFFADCGPRNIFKATFGTSFGSLSFGNVAQAGFSEEFVRNDLTAVGSLAGGGDLGNVDLIYIPEPSAMFLAVLGIVGLLRWRR